jgi:hypothetical protein
MRVLGVEWDAWQRAAIYAHLKFKKLAELRATLDAQAVSLRKAA